MDPGLDQRLPRAANDIPRAARTLLARLSDWSTLQRAATGPCAFTGLGAPRGDGTCPRVEVTEDVDSFLVRAHHADGRALTALWVRRQGSTRWSLDMAWRGRHAGEWTPHRLTARQLTAYVVAPDADSALDAVRPTQMSLEEVA